MQSPEPRVTAVSPGGPLRRVGYAELLEALADENHPEYEMYLEQVGNDFDSEEFDLEEVNEMLAEV